MRHLVALTLLVAGSAGCCASILDEDFASHGVLRLHYAPMNALELQPLAIAVQADGKIVLGGFIQNASPESPALARLNADGMWDSAFGSNAIVVVGGPSSGAAFIERLQLFSDGSVLAAGGTGLANATTHPSCTLLAKTNAVGTVTNSFGPNGDGRYCFDFATDNGRASYYHADIAIDSDDTFYLTSGATNLDHGAVAHFGAGGTLLGSYGTGGIAALPGNVFSRLLQLRDDHSLVAIGTGDVADGNNTFNVSAAAFTTAGMPDLTYGTNGSISFDQAAQTITDAVYAAPDALGNLVIADNDGGLSPLTNLPYRVARLTPQGALDPTFNPSAQQPGSPGLASLSMSGSNQDYVIAAQPLPDGHIFVVGSAGSMYAGDGQSNIALQRLNPDASYDTSFGDAAHPGRISMNLGGLAGSGVIPRSIATDGNGKIYLLAAAADSQGTWCTAILRLQPDRLFDSAFEAAAPFPDCPPP